MIRKIVTIVLTITIAINIFSINSMAKTSNNGNFYIQYDGQIYRYKNRFVDLIINGNNIKTGDMPALIITENIDGKNIARTLVPVREVCESEQIGASVEWNGQKKEIYISYEDKFIVLKIDDRKALVNNKEVTLDVPAKLIQNVGTQKWKTMVPIRFIVETFGYEVEWNGKDYSAIMTNHKDTSNQEDDKDQIDVEPTDEEDDINTEENEEEAINTEDNVNDNDNEESEDNEDSDIEHEDINNDNNDTTNENNEELLEEIKSGGSKNELPTELKDNPIVWAVDDERLSQINEEYTQMSVVRKLCPTTSIQKVEYISDEDSKRFVIKAEGAITDIKKNIWENKLILDIDNSKCDTKSKINFKNNPFVSQIRTSQFEDKVTRVVFDLQNSGNNYSINLSEDRKEINIVAKENSIYSIQLGQNEKGDFIEVLGLKAPDVKSFRLSNPDRIIFDLPSTISLLNSKSSSAQGQYVKEIRTSQFNSTTSRIVVETEGQADYNIVKKGENTTLIQLVEPSYDNINYINKKTPTIILEKQDMDIDISKIKCVDKYIDRKYIIDLSDDYSKLFGSGIVRINDGIFNNININNNDKNNTIITINESTIYDYRITEDDKNVYIKAYKPDELYSQIVVIDPGHGDTDPGTVGNGLKEKDVNLDITLFLKQYLDEDKSIKTYYCRTTDIRSSLQDRCDIANEVKCDFFVSIHNNSASPNPVPNGTEVYYLAPSSKPGMTSQKLADIFLQNILEAAGTKNRGCKTANYYVLRNTDMSAILLEIAFVSNDEDAARLKSDTFKKNVANSIYKSIKETFNKFPTNR